MFIVSIFVSALWLYFNSAEPRSHYVQTDWADVYFKRTLLATGAMLAFAVIVLAIRYVLSQANPRKVLIGLVALPSVAYFPWAAELFVSGRLVFWIR